MPPKKKGDVNNRIIGERIAQERISQFLTQQELADMIQKTQKNVSDLERGRTAINAVDLMKVALALEKPAGYFLPQDYEELDISNDERDVLIIYRKIAKEDNRALARKLLRDLADRSIKAFKDKYVNGKQPDRRRKKAKKN